MTRPFRKQVDEMILDRAAGLIARRGLAKTSIQDVADAVGLSKAGLLHHFPSKDALHVAALTYAGSIGVQVVDQVRHLPVGIERDRLAVELLLDVALSHPGVVALMLMPTVREDVGRSSEHDPTYPLQAFGVDPDVADLDRFIRVASALAAIAVLSVAADDAGQITQWRPHIVESCFDALGHCHPDDLASAVDGEA